MNSRLRILATIFTLFITASSLAGCSFEPGERTQLAGQECYSDSQCVEGLVCVERRCRPQGAISTTDAGTDSSDVPTLNDAVDVPDEGDGIVFVDAGQDADQACEPGTRRCSGDSIVECAEDGTRFLPVRTCPNGLQCRSGQCTDTDLCTDQDNDGYGSGCPMGEDCNDESNSVNPGVSEQCDTPIDDNCDGQVNEGCTECCPGGCGADEFCSNCQCVPQNTAVCQYQDQPCPQEGMNNGYYCTDISNSGQLRCLGICQMNADDPSSTCPDPGSICAFGDGPQGVCLSGCTISQGCGVPGYGCLPYDGYDREGICVPTNPNNQVGDACDGEQIFDCEEGAICIDLQRGARCAPACRAFANADSSASDCNNGHCVPLTDRLGMCRPDAGQSQEGDSCNQRQIFRACNQDSVICVPSGSFQGPQCNRFCRLTEGDADCAAGQTCYQYDQQRDDLGICVTAME